MKKYYDVGVLPGLRMRRYPRYMDVTGLNTQARINNELGAFNRLEAELGIDPSPRLLLQGHKSHNRVLVLDDYTPGEYRVDGLIIQNKGKQMMLGGLAADCPMVAFCSTDWVGMVHLGSPELQAGATEIFLENWLTRNDAHKTFVIISPHIQDKYYEWKNQIQGGLDVFLRTSSKTRWFDIGSAVVSKLTAAGIPRINILASKKNTWLMAHHGTGSSYRWYTKHQEDFGATDTRDFYVAFFN